MRRLFFRTLFRGLFPCCLCGASSLHFLAGTSSVRFFAGEFSADQLPCAISHMLFREFDLWCNFFVSSIAEGLHMCPFSQGLISCASSMGFFSWSLLRGTFYMLSFLEHFSRTLRRGISVIFLVRALFRYGREICPPACSPGFFSVLLFFLLQAFFPCTCPRWPFSMLLSPEAFFRAPIRRNFRVLFCGGFFLAKFREGAFNVISFASAVFVLSFHWALFSALDRRSFFRVLFSRGVFSVFPFTGVSSVDFPLQLFPCAPP